MISLSQSYQKNENGENMSKQWTIKKSELKQSTAYFGKRCAPKKYDELYNHIFSVCDFFPNSDNVSTIARSVVEEVVNILEHNKSYTYIKVRSDLNSTKSRVKFDIIYDGMEYYDPEKHNIRTVIGSVGRLEDYCRKVEVSSNKVTIRVNFKPKRGQ